MLKKRYIGWAAVVCTFYLALANVAQELTETVLSLHLRVDESGVRMLRSTSAPGRLKESKNPGAQNGRLEYDISQAGPVVHSGAVSDPRVERFEFPEANDPGALRSEVIRRAAGEFVIRVPGNSAGRLLRFFRGVERGAAGDDADLTKRAVNRTFLSEIVIPLPEPRLKAFAAAAQFYTLRTNGPTAARLNIAILAEGFTTAERSSFTNRAQNLLDQFLNVSPYKEYRNHFNAFAIFVPSEQSGSDHPDQNRYRNTYFNSSYGTGGLVRLITIPPNEFSSNYSEGRGKVFALLEQFVPEYDIVLLLVNDSEYGGSGGVPAIASINASAVELALHEVSHSFAGLGDEYDSPYPGYPDIEEPNTTRETRRDRIKWRDWIQPSTPIPTPESAAYRSVVGLFEGAHFHPTGWYRPKLDCRMQTLGQPFCEVCKEAIVLSTYSTLGIIQGSSPAENNLTVPGGGELLLSVQTTSSAEAPLVYAWTVDGETNSAYASDTFPASFDTLGVGTRLVRASVHDPTPLVRTDPTAKLWKTRSWLVQVLSASNQPPVIGPIANQQAPSRDSFIIIPFTASDPDTPAASLVFSAHSSDTNLVSTRDMFFSGSGTNRTLTFATHCGLSGTAAITVMVSDGGNTVSNSFAFTVVPDSQDIVVAPIPDQIAYPGALIIPLQIHYDGCNPAQLELHASSDFQELFPNENLVFEPAGTNWNLRLTPSAGMTGSARITVGATDGTNATARTFLVTITDQPFARAHSPLRTEAGLLLKFTVEPPTSLVLESSPDLEFWTPIRTASPTNSLEHLVPGLTLGTRNFYRLRLVPAL